MTVLPKRSTERLAVESNRRAVVGASLALTLLARATPAAAQESLPYSTALTTWIALPANPGYEQIATGRIASATRGFVRDAMGNLVRRVGSGAPRRVVACGLDEVGYAVSEITEDGYLRVHGAGNGRRHPLWDQFHEGQRVYLLAHGADQVRYVPGVFAVRSTHLWRRRSAEESPTTIEDLWIDVGARSRAEVARLDIRVLDPVFREWPAWTFADYAAGPGAANRAGCAAVAAASQSAAPPAGQTTFVIGVQSRFGFAGLTSVLATLGEVDTLVLVDAELARAGNVPASPRTVPWAALSRLRVHATLAVTPRSRFPGTLVESIRESDIIDLHAQVARLAGMTGGTPQPVRLARGWAAPPPAVVRDSLSTPADLLARLTDVYGVAGHESPVRDAVRDALPSWARDSAVVDTAGNLVLAMGPERDTVVFVAHVDEIGFEITRIARDGTVSLRNRGGFFPSLWEGQTALLHRPDQDVPAREARGCGAAREGPLRGVFVPRDSAPRKQPVQMTAWFGVDSAALIAAGARIGMALTSYKCSARLAGTRFTARSIDDRAGSSALLLALESIDRTKLIRRTIFVWSVREEGGLEGAKALAQQFGATVRRAYAIDTFVSSDSPLENNRFAHALIGEGAVARALDNSGVTPPDDVDRLTRLARAARIPLQVGTTNGGNDGSELVRYGAVNVPIGWPLRYSHSPAEVIDLRDVRSLARIIAAVAQTR
jgi:putative aminopeptidase